MLVYPNPSQGIITIELIDASGQVLLQATPTNQTLDVSHLAAGVYYLRFVGSDVRTEKLMLK